MELSSRRDEAGNIKIKFFTHDNLYAKIVILEGDNLADSRN